SSARSNGQGDRGCAMQTPFSGYAPPRHCPGLRGPDREGSRKVRTINSGHAVTRMSISRDCSTPPATNADSRWVSPSVLLVATLSPLVGQCQPEQPRKLPQRLLRLPGIVLLRRLEDHLADLPQGLDR